MTKGEAVDLIFLAVNGGELKESSKVQRDEIAVYIGTVIDYVQKLDIDQRKEELRRNRYQYVLQNLANLGIDEDLYCTYTLVPIEDKKRAEHYVVLPVTIQSLPGNAGLDYSGPLRSDGKPFVKLMNRYGLAGPLESALKNQTVYYYEKNADVNEHRVYYKNLSHVVKEVLVRLAATVADLTNESILPIPQGYEKHVIDLTVEFFMHQREIPGDYNYNKIDENFGQGQ